MSDLPPLPAEPARYKKRHKNRGCAVGCGVLLILGIIGTISAAMLMFTTFNRAVFSVMSEERRPFSAIKLPPEAQAAVRQQIEDFAHALDRGESPPELLLSADEVNAALEELARKNKMENPVRVAFENDRIQAELSVPLRGLYLNGSGELSLGFNNGVLMVFVNTLEVNGKQPPADVMDLVKNHNLAQIFMDDPESQRIIKRLQYVTVTNGKLRITPKPAGGA